MTKLSDSVLRMEDTMTQLTALFRATQRDDPVPELFRLALVTLNAQAIILQAIWKHGATSRDIHDYRAARTPEAPADAAPRCCQICETPLDEGTVCADCQEPQP
jgi:hypothetical protein